MSKMLINACIAAIAASITSCMAQAADPKIDTAAQIYTSCAKGMLMGSMSTATTRADTRAYVISLNYNCSVWMMLWYESLTNDDISLWRPVDVLRLRSLTLAYQRIIEEEVNIVLNIK